MFATSTGLVSGKTDLADFLFLVGLVLFLVGGILHAIRPPAEPHAHAAVAFGLAAMALAWLVL